MEFVVALTVFGMMTAGIFEFMANQTENLADIRKKDDWIYGTQVICNWTINEDINGIKVRNYNMLYNVDHNITAGRTTDYEYRNKQPSAYPYFTIEANASPITYIEEKVVSFDWDKDTHILTVRKNNTSMKIELKP